MFGFVYFLFFWFFEIFCLLVPFIYILLFYLYVVYFKLYIYIYIYIGNNESEKTFLLKRFQRNSSTVKISYINMFCTNLNYNFVLT